MSLAPVLRKFINRTTAVSHLQRADLLGMTTRQLLQLNSDLKAKNG